MARVRRSVQRYALVHACQAAIDIRRLADERCAQPVLAVMRIRSIQARKLR